jgi:NAD-dependent dihydropyrimidine dehydrogenase PreA subunit
MNAAMELNKVDTIVDGYDADESALLAIMQDVQDEARYLPREAMDRIAEPRAKHIHTVVSGLNDKPSNLNNVETWANIPLIISKGSDWYTKMGTENCITGEKKKLHTIEQEKCIKCGICMDVCKFDSVVAI